jgi:hypothetical protein
LEAAHQPERIVAQFRRPALWSTAVGYVLLTFGVQYVISTELFKAFVEQNQDGFMSGYFMRFAGGLDVVGDVRRQIALDVLFYQQVLAALVVVVLWRKYKAVSLGILTALLSGILMVLCVVFLMFSMIRHGY